MKSYVAMALVVFFSSPILAALTTDVYLSDGNTPLALRDPNVPHVYRDIMVGTKLSVIISSDSRRTAAGTISMSWDDWTKGKLAARDFNDLFDNWDGSCLEAAGRNAGVIDIPDSSRMAYYFFSGPPLVRTGQWFVWDYRAKAVGTNQVIVTDMTSIANPIVTTLTFNHMLSRDFNRDAIVNFKDFALFANHWRRGGVFDCNGVPCEFDLNADGYPDTADLTLLGAYWLRRTDANEPAANKLP